MEATTPKPKKRDRIGVILYLLYVLLLIASLVLILRLAGIQLFWKPDTKIADALTPSNTISVIEPARGNILDAEGRLLFRPAGHGALLENLNERDADVVFIKNVDNVVPLRLRSVSTRYKKVIGGYLVQVQRQLKKYLESLDKGNVKSADLKAMLRYANQTLCITDKATEGMDDESLAAWLRDKFNRPIRVCGVVPNEGEPGGGPYLAYNADGSASPQILESAQINPDDPAAVEMMKGGTHFNPVDLVCYIKDYKGIKFDLRKFVDAETGFISIKSKDGVDIKALELPGLWNGSMSNWNTLFVEVPIDTFNPVKTVNDLLRPSHQ